MIDGDGKPSYLRWDYDRAEIIADGVIHVVGLAAGLVGAGVLIALAASSAGVATVAAICVYAAGLIGMLSASAAYNLWPVSRTKWRLRRLDHALIFVLIAGTYTPLLVTVGQVGTTILLAVVWVAALGGAALKVALPGRLDKTSIALCLAIGFSVVATYDQVAAALPSSTVVLMVAGGLVYTAGIVFHLWESLRFQNAVWHGFVLVASALFYSAILDGVVLAAA